MITTLKPYMLIRNNHFMHIGKHIVFLQNVKLIEKTPIQICPILFLLKCHDGDTTKSFVDTAFTRTRWAFSSS